MTPRATVGFPPGSTLLVAHQPAYLPWQGYFARLLDADRLVLLDHVQFCERGRQHRNWIRGHDGGRQLLTVPVRRSGRFGQSIRNVEIADPRWARRHWRTIEQVYRRASYFDLIADELCAFYDQPWTTLAEVNTSMLRLLLGALGLSVKLEYSSATVPAGRKTAMLIDLCRRSGASVLRVGTGAPRYLDAQLLAASGIQVEIIRFTHPSYDQGGRPFVPGLAMLDLLVHQGPHARDVLAAGTQLSAWDPVTLEDRR
jgi:hypothetical protein